MKKMAIDFSRDPVTMEKGRRSQKFEWPTTARQASAGFVSCEIDDITARIRCFSGICGIWFVSRGNTLPRWVDLSQVGILKPEGWLRLIKAPGLSLESPRCVRVEDVAEVVIRDSC